MVSNIPVASTPNFFLHTVECFPWASYVNSPDCIDTALVLNGWATEEEISSLGDTDKKSRLVEGLHFRLNPDIHSKPDLGKREAISDQGGLCGLAAMSHALGSTVTTTSVLRTLDYDLMREEMASEVFISRQKLPEYMDLDLLKTFYECKHNYILIRVGIYLA